MTERDNVPSMQRKVSGVTTRLDTDDIQKRWHTCHDRSADDYTDAGCRVLAEHAFRDIPSLLTRVKEQDIENFALRSLNAEGQRNVDELIERVRSLQGELRRMDEKNAKMASALKPFAALGFPGGVVAANISLMGSWVAAAREALRRDGK